MLRFFPGGFTPITSMKFCAINGILSAQHYVAHPLAFNSNLMMTCPASGIIKNLSFSSFSATPPDSNPNLSMFSLNINQTSREADVSFNSNRLYYTRCVTVPEEILENINQTAWQLYRHLECQDQPNTKRPEPYELLRDFALCAIIHGNLVKPGFIEDKDFNNKMLTFIELLTDKINAELKRLGVETESHTVNECDSPSYRIHL